MSSALFLKRHSHEGNVTALSELPIVHYSGIELLMIGFASAFITFLWVGVFSSFLAHVPLSVPSSASSFLSTAGRGISQQVHIAVAGASEAGMLITDTISYQFKALWESSCITQQTCIGGLTRIGDEVESFAGSFAGLSEHSHRVVALGQDLASLRFLDAQTHLAQILSPQKAYAADVLGEKTVSSQELLKNTTEGYFQFVDSLSFGAVSALNPELVGRNPTP